MTKKYNVMTDKDRIIIHLYILLLKSNNNIEENAEMFFHSLVKPLVKVSLPGMILYARCCLKEN
jgi:hypothetical protein